MPPTPRPRLRPRKQPRQERAQATVAALVEATARVLVSRGWSGTTTNHIAKQAGVSVGTLYEYFPGKEALVTALVEQHLQEVETQLLALAGRLAATPPTLESLIREIVTLMIELHGAAPQLHRVLFEEVPHHKDLLDRVRAMEDAQTGALAHQLASLLPLREPEVTARVIVELLEALTHRWVVAPGATEPLPRPRMQRELERLVLAYVRSSAADPP